MDNTADVWQLVARVLNNEASTEEQQELIEILRRDETLQQQYDLLTRIWKEKESNIDYPDREAAQNIISRIINKAEDEDTYIALFQNKIRSNRKRNWLVAASVLIVLLGGWFWMNRQSAANNIVETKQETIEARIGSKTRSVLADGSTVWLNAGSKLYYENDFTGSTREVRLEGEAFFDVVKNANQPFIVHTSGIDIKVLGTSFSVKSYPEDKNVVTTLYRGSVKVFRHDESEINSIQLKPNQKLTLAKEAATQKQKLSDETNALSSGKIAPASPAIAHIDSTKKDNERAETAWVYNRFEFRGDNFEELARKLERWYNVTIVFTDEQVKQLSFDGSFEGETVDKAFRYLHVANPSFNYKIINHEISVGSVQ
jgi:transmembrane sensor